MLLCAVRFIRLQWSRSQVPRFSSDCSGARCSCLLTFSVQDAFALSCIVNVIHLCSFSFSCFLSWKHHKLKVKMMQDLRTIWSHNAALAVADRCQGNLPNKHRLLCGSFNLPGMKRVSEDGESQLSCDTQLCKDDLGIFPSFLHLNVLIKPSNQSLCDQGTNPMGPKSFI